MTLPSISPFRALRYNPHKIRDLSQVVAPPYDVISPEQRERLAGKNPHNVVRLILSQEKDGKEEGLNRYQIAKRFLQEWQEQEVLIRDPKPAIYLYDQTYSHEGKSYTRKGFIALKKLESFESGKVRPHEHTFSGPKQDRLNLIRETQTNLSPIFGIYSDPEQEIGRLLQSLRTLSPLFEIQTEEGQAHKLWKIEDPSALEALARQMESKTIFIADGHHRYETALNYRNECRLEHPHFSGEEPFNSVMMYFCGMEDEGLLILPTHRVVTVCSPLPWDAFEKNFREVFEVEVFQKEEKEKAFEKLHSFAVDRIALLVALPEGRLYLLSASPDKILQHKKLQQFLPEVRTLDVTILHQLILPHLLQIQVGQEYDAEKILYAKESQECFDLLDSGRGKLAFFLNPTKIRQVATISRLGERMPQKSTFFYPKLLSGLLFNPLKP